MDIVGVYSCNSYTAYFYDSKIIICTNIQCIKVTPFQYYDIKYLAFLRERIESGKCLKMYDLSLYQDHLVWMPANSPMI